MSNTITRGDKIQNGRYVGTSRAGVTWIARATRSLSVDQSFAVQSERFDALRGREVVKMTKISSQNVLDVAERNAVNGAEGGVRYCERVVIGRTVITAPRAFFADLAPDLLEAADDWKYGDRNIGQECFSRDLDSRFEEAAGLRIAKSLQRYAARAAKLG